MIAPPSFKLQDSDPSLYFLSFYRHDTHYLPQFESGHSCAGFLSCHSFGLEPLKEHYEHGSPATTPYPQRALDSSTTKKLSTENFEITSAHLSRHPLRQRNPNPRSLTRKHPYPRQQFAGHADMAATAPPSSPPELSSSKSSTQSSPSSNDEQYDPSHFEDISLAEDSLSVATATPSPNRAPRPRPLVKPALRTNSFPRSSLQSPQAFNEHCEPSPCDAHSRPPPRGATSPSPRGTWRRGQSTPVLNSAAVPSPQHGSRNRLPPATRANPFPFAPQSPVSPSRHARPPPTSTQSFENSTASPSSFPARRGSWQKAKRKSAQELEDEYHDSDEDLPEDAIVWNVPLTPRAMPSRSPSKSPVREQQGKVERLPPQPQTGSLEKRPKGKPPRSKSWTEAMWDLSDEAKALTQALESHAATGRPGSSDSPLRPTLHHAKTIALPPVRRGDALIDPLPPSKEKEKFLTRTRPSWLPPKSKKEEKKHLKEWEKMMVDFVAAEKRKSAASDESETKSTEDKSSTEAKTAEV